MPLSDSEKQDLLKEARENRDKAEDFDRMNAEEAREDLRFIAGEQWDEADINQRREDGRPYQTINQLPQFVNQITGDVRLNPPSIKVLPAEEGDSAIAQIYTGLIRNIEYQSNATRAYITASESSIRCGIGHFRIVTEFADDDTFNQEIRIKRVVNPFSVLWDPTAQKFDRSDAGYCFLLEEMDRDAFKAKYPNAVVSEFDRKDTEHNVNRWVTRDTVTVAEYWRKEKITKKLGQLRSGEVVDLTDMGEGEAGPLDIIQTRDVDSHKVVQYFITDSDVLEGPLPWVGRHIPIVPVIGQEIHIGERVVRHGIVRFAKDAQRNYNYWQTAATETMALAPKSPYIATEKQVANHPEWDDANRRNYSVLTYAADPDAPGPPTRNPPPDVPVAAFNQMQVAAQDMRATIGLHDPNLGAVGNETSGLAISLRQSQGNVGTYVYIDNLAAAIEYAGRQLVDIIPKIYDSQRIVRVMGESDDSELVTINQTIGVTPANEPILINDLAVGKYDVVVKTGPSFATKRIEAANGMMQFIQAFPQSALAAGDLVAKAQDWPMADEFAARLAPPEGPPPPSPEEEAKVAKDQADAAKRAAEAEKTIAETEGQNLENIQLAQQIEQGPLGEVIAAVVRKQLTDILNPPQQG